MVNFSFCLIIKNEAKNLRQCLEPIKNLQQEIVIVDTGSTDESLAVAGEYTDKIYSFDWINDFSAARNFAMEKASNNFVFFLDADEFTTGFDMDKLDRLSKEFPDAIGRITRRNKCASGSGYSFFIDPVERFFDKRIYMYAGAIHEQVVRRDGKMLTGYMLDWFVYHEGYYGTPEALRAKGLRNAQLLLKDLEKDPSDAYTYYQLGQSYDLFEDFGTALGYYEKAESLKPDKSLEYTPLLITSYGHSLINAGRFSDALSLEEKYPEFLEDADFVFMLAAAATEDKKLIKALDLYDRALSCQIFHTEGTNSHKALHNKACILYALGNYEEADFLFKKAGSDCPESSQAALKAGDKAFKISLIINVRGPELLGSFFSALEKQTIGLSYLELIILVNTTDEKTINYLSAFEQSHSQNVLLVTGVTANNDKEAFLLGCSYVSAGLIFYTDCFSLILPDTLRLAYQIYSSLSAGVIQMKAVPFKNSDEEAAEKLLWDYSEDQLDIRLYPIDLSNPENIAFIKEKRLVSKPLLNTFYSTNFIASIGIPSEENIIENASVIYIMDNICFIRCK